MSLLIQDRGKTPVVNSLQSNPTPSPEAANDSDLPFNIQLTRLTRHSTLADLPCHDCHVSSATRGHEVSEAFERWVELPGIVVHGPDGSVDMISRQNFFSHLSRAFAREIYLKRPIQVLLSAVPAAPLRFSHTHGIAEAAHAALNRPVEWAYEPLLINYPDGTVRVLDIHTLLLAQTQLLTLARRQEEQMYEAGKMEVVGQLAGGVAHDFNNLLTVILASLSMLGQSSTLNGDERELLSQAESAASRAAALTNQLLGFSRRKAVLLETVDPNRCIRDTVSMLRRTIGPAVEILVETAADLWQVEADPNQIGQVLMNLCLNARDAMPNGGRLQLAAANVVVDEQYVDGNVQARKGDHVRLRVEDNGQGIPPEVLPHIFEPFYTTKAVGKGTGLGLAMTYSILRQSGGWIECHSRVGVGTRFDLYLPRCTRSAFPAPTVAVTPAPPPISATVLLVDDEEMIRNIGRLVLRQHGYQVLLAKDGLDALEVYQREQGRIDLVILDLLMPRLGGRDALRRLRQIDPGVRVLFSSGYSPETVTESAADGVLGMISKPYRPQDVADAVRQALAAPARKAVGKAAAACVG